MRLLSGLGQALVVWVVALVLIVLVRDFAVMWAVLGAAVVTVIGLGKWHRRRSRADTAVGAYTGAVLWPVLIGTALIAINIVSAGLSSHE